MSVQDLTPNLDEAAAEPEDLTLRRLVRAIDYAEGFWLGFAKSNTPAQRRRLAALCKDLLEPLKVRVLEIELTEPVTDPLPVLRECLAQEHATHEEVAPPAKDSATTNGARATTSEASAASQPKLAIFVYGLERSISSREVYPPLLSSLNLNRELFRQQLPHPLLLWLPDYALTAIARQAPDFWAWRSGLYEFAPERESAERSLEAVRGEELHITESLSEQAKRERLVMLKGLLEDYREMGDGRHEQDAIASILNEIGLVHEVLGEWTEAKQAYGEYLTISRNLNDDAREAIALHNLGGIAQDQGEIEEARRLYGESLEIKRRLGSRRGVAITLHNLAMLAQAQGKIEEARRFYGESLEIAKRLGDQRGVAATLHQLGRLAEDGDSKTEAARLFREALSIFERLRSPDAEVARRSLARVKNSDGVSD